MTRLYARAPRNERAPGSAPCGHWRRLTVLGALSGEGMVAAMSIEAATTTRVFLAFLRAVLVPELLRRHPNATVLMDNLPAHKPRAVETVLAEAGIKLLYLPRYSPDLSPIEPGWSKTTRLVQDEECLAGRRGAHTRSTRSRSRARPRQHHPRRRSRLVQLLRLPVAKLM